MKAIIVLISKKFLQECEKLKGMTFKEKCGYIWEYYNAQIIITTTVLFITGGIIYSVFLSPAPKPYAEFLIIGNIQVALQEDLTELLTENLVEDKKSEKIYATIVPTEESEMSYENTMRVYTKMTARDLDLLCTAESMFQIHAGDGRLDDLSKYLTSGELEELEGRLYYVTAEGDTLERPYGIYFESDIGGVDISGSEERYVVGVVMNTRRIDNALTLLRWLVLD